MDKILILSCSTGGGHNSVAMAIKELFESHNKPSVIIDVLSFVSKKWPEIASDVHAYVYRHRPSLFNKGYQYAEDHRKELEGDHPIRKLLDKGSRKLSEYINTNEFSYVICTHPFAGIMLTDAIKNYDLNLKKTGIVETDYTVSPGAEDSILNWHFVPSSINKEQLMNLGISAGNIAVTGIPVRKQFASSTPVQKAKKDFGLDIDKRHIVVACGSMGCGPIDDILDFFAEYEMPSIEISAVCGNNKQLYKRLSEKYCESKSIHILPRINNMSELLDTADVYMTKPGGISTTEAASKSVPLVLINEVGGCELHNYNFFMEKAAAKSGETVENLCKNAIKIAQDENINRTMRNAQNTIYAENNIETIYNCFFPELN